MRRIKNEIINAIVKHFVLISWTFLSGVIIGAFPKFKQLYEVTPKFAFAFFFWLISVAFVVAVLWIIRSERKSKLLLIRLCRIRAHIKSKIATDHRPIVPREFISRNYSYAGALWDRKIKSYQDGTILAEVDGPLCPQCKTLLTYGGDKIYKCPREKCSGWVAFMDTYDVTMGNVKKIAIADFVNNVEKSDFMEIEKGI
jgi:hypothetical protein